MVRPWLSIVALVSLAAGAQAQQPAEDAEAFFEARIRPVLAARCFKCHGGEKTSSGLRVDSRDALVAGGDSGPAIAPGEPDNSLLVRAIRRGEDLKMPPDVPLPNEEVAALERWVMQGAPWPAAAPGKPGLHAARHWAFEPVRPVALPADDSGWSQTPVDRFILAELRKHELEPQPTTDRATLLRRISFDLIGLPPTPQQIDAFVRDDSPDAFDRLVDRLLASPRYGERWGRHWMDVVRYADTAGDNADYPVPEARHYRDYIISAFNNDKAYDEFIREQLAGDILAAREPERREAYAERVAATGFLALSRRYATAPYELWHLTVEDTIDTTGRAILGLSLRCARCHDHKFDPVTTQDYYGLYGIFASTQFPWAGGEELSSKKFDRQHFVPLVPPAEAAPRLAAQRDEAAVLEAEIKRAEGEDPDAKRVAELDAQLKQRIKGDAVPMATSAGDKPGEPDAEIAALNRERSEAKKRLNGTLEKIRGRLRQVRKPGLPPDLPAAYAVHDGQATDVRVQRRGEPSDAGEVVRRDVPKFLAGDKSLEIPPGASGRLELARWLTRPEHPLVARVIVNRVWHYHFGKGLAPTPSNLGLRGEAPTHPELLDWLTARFVEEGWSVKNLHRLIVRSKVYQLASGHDDTAAARDPGNRWYWRFDRRRLEAEAIRDAMLSAAGKLDLRTPDDHPFPPIAEWNWTQHSPFKAVYPSSHRSVYLMTQRLVRHPYLALFDGPDPNVSTDVRTSATVPLQALYLMNNPFVAEQATAFARRLTVQEAEPGLRIALGFRLAYGRDPRADELVRGAEYIKRYTDESTSAGREASQSQADAWASYARVLLTSNEFVYVE